MTFSDASFLDSGTCRNCVGSRFEIPLFTLLLNADLWIIGEILGSLGQEPIGSGR